MLQEMDYQMTDGTTTKSPKDTHLVFRPSDQPENWNSKLYAD